MLHQQVRRHVRHTPRVRRELSPGTEFRYSGSHYAVLEQFLTDVTGTPFDKLMATLVLEPVGMADSSYDERFPYEHRAEHRLQLLLVRMACVGHSGRRDSAADKRDTRFGTFPYYLDRDLRVCLDDGLMNGLMPV